MEKGGGKAEAVAMGAEGEGEMGRDARASLHYCAESGTLRCKVLYMNKNLCSR